MKDRVQIEVEPFSDAKWARVERGVFAARLADATREPPQPGDGERTWRRPVVACAALVAVLAAAALLFLIGRAWLPAGQAEVARIVTSDGASRYTFGESTLEVDRDSVLLVRGDDEHGVALVVDRGRVTCEVAPRRGRPPFVVDAGDVRVRVVGTRFTVVREGAAARVAVDHGVVEVTSRGVVTTLHDGESWPAPAEPTVASVTAPPAPEEASEPARHAGLLPMPHARKRRSPHDTAPPAPPPAPSAATAPVASPPPAAQPTPQERFERATRLERAQPEQAEALYRQVAGTSSPWAANALFALARLEADHGERAEARRLVDQYLERYPAGTNAADARELRDRLR